MPLLLSVLQNANGSEYHKLRLKAMECAGLVGESRFVPLCPPSLEKFHQQSPLAETCSEKTLASCANFSCKFKVCLVSSRRQYEGVTTLRIDSPIEPDDTLLSSYLIASWAKICQALGQEFEPYLPVVMPPLLRAASAKADVSVIGLSPDRFSGSVLTASQTKRTSDLKATLGQRSNWRVKAWGSSPRYWKRSAKPWRCSSSMCLPLGEVLHLI